MTKDGIAVTVSAPEAQVAIENVPCPVEDKGTYLLAIDCAASDVPVTIGWTWYGDDGEVVYEDDLVAQRAIPEARWFTAALDAPPGASTVQVRMGASRGKGTALFREALLMRVEPPR